MLHLQDYENLGDNVDYSGRFVTDRKFDSADELHAWADEIAIGIDFQFTRASYKQKEGLTKVSLYLRCPKSRTYRCKFMIVCSSRKPGEKCYTD